MQADDLLTEEANRLLRDAARTSSAPHYTDRSFFFKCRTQDRRAVKKRWHSGGLGSFSSWEISEGTIGRVICSASLTKPQKQVLSLRLAGLTYAEIGAVLKLSKQGAHKRFSKILGQLKDAYANETSAGSAEVYDELTRMRTGDSSFMD